MDPITIAVLGGIAIQGVSGLMQYYQAEKARGANEARLRQIEAMFDQIVPPEYDVKVWDDPAIAQAIPAPALNLDKIDPQLYESVGQFVPEIAEFVRETNPQLVEATEVGRQGQQAQLEALQRYREIAASETDPMLQQQLAEASLRARTEAQSRADTVLQDAARRGQLGSGIQIAAQMGQAGNAMQANALESQRAAAEAYRNRLAAMDRSASLGGNIRAQDIAEQSRNTGIINDFNQRTSRAYQSYLQDASNTRNQAQLNNLREQQRLADSNVDLENRAMQEWINRSNAGKSQLYDVARQQRNDRINLEQLRQNTLQQNYDNKMKQAGAKAGIGNTYINMQNQAAQDTNRAIGGVADAATAGSLYWGKSQQAKLDGTKKKEDEEEFAF